jgi:hypothetical protein
MELEGAALCDAGIAATCSTPGGKLLAMFAA